MKFFSSSSSLDLNSGDAASGCISGVFHHLLCGGLFGRSSNLVEEVHVAVGSGQQKKQAVLSQAPPGLVPRLMGLDSMPKLLTASAPSSVGRSRSTGSIENRAEQRYHNSPWSRSSPSFSEVPTFLRQENDEFLVLSFGFDDGGEIERQKGLVESEEIKGENPNARRRSTEKRNERNHQPIHGRENGTGRSSVHDINGVQVSERKGGAHQRPENQKQMLPERNKLGSDTKTESECSSQNSSPVSVLDSRLEFEKESSINPNTPISEEDLRRVQRNSRRKLSSELDNLNSLSPSRLKPAEEEIKEDAKCRLLKCSEEHVKISVEEDMVQTNWPLRELWKLEGEFEEIAIGFQLQILDLLLQEAVTELSLSSALQYCT